jgi:chemotaxis receptor (MCP) glutamine deamidase CheD
MYALAFRVEAGDETLFGRERTATDAGLSIITKDAHGLHSRDLSTATADGRISRRPLSPEV